MAPSSESSSITADRQIVASGSSGPVTVTSVPGNSNYRQSRDWRLSLRTGTPANAIGQLGPNSSFAELRGVRDGILRQRLNELQVRGEQLKIMVIGEAGVGKTTLLTNLFARAVDPELEDESNGAGPRRQTAIVESRVEFTLDGLPFSVILVDSPGYGDNFDLNQSFDELTRYLKDCYQRAMELENRPDRHNGPRPEDEIVDAVLYFIAPHRMKQLDIELMKRVHKLTPVIPILAKADAMTANELSFFRAAVTARLQQEKIRVFHEPFAIVASYYAVKDENGDVVVGRDYPWGFVSSENEEYSDMLALRRCLLIDGLANLREVKMSMYEDSRWNKIRSSRKSAPARLLGSTIRTLAKFAIIAVLLPLAKQGSGRVLKEIDARQEEMKAERRRQEHGGLFGLFRR